MDDPSSTRAVYLPELLPKMGGRGVFERCLLDFVADTDI